MLMRVENAKHNHVDKLLKPWTDKNVPVPSAVVNRMNLVEIQRNLVQNLLKHNVGFIKPLRLGINQRK
jgi:hypothetical protein